ncbi:MAG: GNAT family N-acetyltransferase [Granulosicoccus sp.]
MAPSPDLKSERLCLRSFSERHLSERYVSWLNDTDTTKFSEQRHRLHTMGSCRQFVQSFSTGPNQLWAIETSDTEEHIGNVTVSHDTNNRIADIGILIGSKTVRGCGYGYAAWKAVLEYLSGRDDIYKITGGCMQPNKAMVRIMESCGMTLDCIRADHFLLDDLPANLVYYSTPGIWKPIKT